MNRAIAVKSITGLFAYCILCTPAMAELDPLEPYDGFDAKKIGDCKKCIDPTKWEGVERGDYVGEISREVKSKRAAFSVRAWGNKTQDEGTSNGINRMLLIDDSDTISGVCFTPRVKKYELNECPGNEDNSNVMVRYVGTAYDSDDTPAGNDLGVVYMGFDFTRSTEDDANDMHPKYFNATGWAVQCHDAQCTTLDWSTADGLVDFGEFKTSNKTEFCVGYDPGDAPGSHQLVFSAGDDVAPIMVGAADGLPPYVQDVIPEYAWHAIETSVYAENCQPETGGKVSAYIEADVDNVSVNRKAELPPPPPPE